LIRLEVLFCFYNKKERGQEDGLQKTENGSVTKRCSLPAAASSLKSRGEMKKYLDAGIPST
jgi:hypothetical protein